MEEKPEQPQELVLPVLRSAVNLEYHVSPPYTKKFTGASEVHTRGDGSVGSTAHYDTDPRDQLVGWLENNNLSILRGAYPGAGHTDRTYLFADQTGIVAVDTYYREFRKPFWETPKEETYHHFVRIHSPRTLSVLPWDLTQTLKVLGYEQQQPTEEFKQRCPQFFKKE